MSAKKAAILTATIIAAMLIYFFWLAKPTSVIPFHRSELIVWNESLNKIGSISEFPIDRRQNSGPIQVDISNFKITNTSKDHVISFTYHCVSSIDRVDEYDFDIEFDGRMMPVRRVGYNGTRTVVFSDDATGSSLEIVPIAEAHRIGN